jgi:amino acid transporter
VRQRAEGQEVLPEGIMIILVIILLILLLAGGGIRYRGGPDYASYGAGIDVVVLILMVVLIIWMLGATPYRY